MLTITSLSIEKKTNNNKRKKTILNNISLSLKDGEIFAYIGPNGAGKSTTIKGILGLEKFKQGKISFFKGQNLETAKKHIGYAPDEAIFYEHLSGIEHLNFFGNLEKKDKNIKIQSQKLLDEVGLHNEQQTLRVKNYSKGMKQRLGLAISLLNDPKLLIRDEPMNGLDPIGRKHIKELMKKLKSQGKTIFFSTHILSDVKEIADRFAIIHQGTIISQHKTTDIKLDLEIFFINQISNHKTPPHLFSQQCQIN